LISVDTSVVVRYLVGRPEDQAARAASLIDSASEIGVSLLVLAETAHVLRSSYDVAREDVAAALIDLLSKANVAPIEVSKAEALEALVRARAYVSSPITDALIAATARAHGARPVYTFDKKFARLGAPIATP
jgi:predicted nucleic acid-binding protein